MVDAFKSMYPNNLPALTRHKEIHKMGIAGIGIWQLVIILAIAFLLFGSGRLRNLGGDLGSAIRGFKTAVGEDAGPSEKPASTSRSKASDA